MLSLAHILNKALAGLSSREERIIRKRHLGYDSVTLEELGKELGVSKERVRQLEQRAMQRLKISLGQNVRRVDDYFLES